MFAVDAFLSPFGDLSIEITNVGETHANLVSDGTEFYVDANNNLVHDPFELRGAIDQLKSISIDSPDAVGTLLWQGDFSSAPLSALRSIDIQTIENVQVNANFSTIGNVSIDVSSHVVLSSEANIGGNLSIQVGLLGTISDTNGASVVVLGDATLTSPSDMTLSDSVSNSWIVSGHTRLESTGSIDIGRLGSFGANQLSIQAANATVNELNEVVLRELLISGDLDLKASISVEDLAGSTIQVDGNLSLRSGTITLANNATDIFSVGGNGDFIATDGNITIAEAGTVTLGSLAASGTNVTVFEDDSMLVQSLAATGNVQIRSSAAIADSANASLTVQGNLAVSGTSITFADSATDVLHVVGDAQFIATAGNVNLGPAGDVRLGSFSATGNDLNVQEDDSTLLMSIDASGNLNVTSTSTVSDKPNASIRITSNASLIGTAILLADNAEGTLAIAGLSSFTATTGDITIAEAGTVILGSLAASGANVTIFEDDAMTIQALSATGNVQLASSAAITDSVDASLTVHGNLAISGTSITLSDSATDILHVDGDAQFIATAGDANLGPAGDVRLGSFSASATKILLQEDDSIVLGSVEAMESLETTTALDISTTIDSRIEALQWNAYANGSIRVADSSSSSIAIATAAFMTAIGNIVIAQPGAVQFGSIGFLADDVSLSEDSPTHLDGSITSSLVVESIGRITQSGMNTGSGVRDLHVAGDARFDLSAHPGEVYLLRQSSSPPNSLADGPLSNNRIDGVVSVSGVLGNIELRNVSPTATVGNLVGSFNNINLWHPNANVVLLGDIRVSGDIDLIAGIESSNTSLGIGNPVDRVSAPNASVQDRGNLLVQGNARFTSAGDILLSDAVNESIRVVGSTSLISFNAGQLVFGTDGMAQSAGIAAFSMDSAGNRGDLVASLDTSTVWETPQVALADGRFLPSLLRNLTLQVNGNLEDSFQASIQLTGDLDITATDSIHWGDQFSNTLHVAGDSFLRSVRGDVLLGSDGVLSMGDSRIEAMGGTIAVGGVGWTRLGIVELFANSIFLSEDEALVVRTAIAEDILDLSSSQEIFNLTSYDKINREGVSASHGLFQAGSHIFLGQVSISELTAIAHANGTLPDTLLFRLNDVADRVGQRFLDVFGSNLPPGVRTNNDLINGTTLTATITEASFLHQFERDYGVYLTNLESLQINTIATNGDGVRVYIETLNGQNLQVADLVSLTSTTTDVGGIVLIAGGQMDILGSGELQIQQTSQPIETQRVVSDEHFSIRAFDGGEGLPGYVSTRDVLYASDAFADSGTQNVLQRVALQYGNRGEAGFEHWIQYADGRIQNFDKSGQLFASQIDSNPQMSRIGPLRAFDPLTSDIAVVERSTPFEDSFLGTFQTLPTLAVFRREFTFFLFEEEGRIDLASSTERSPAFDPVQEVFSPGRKVSLPLPTDIVVSRPILVASQPWVPNTESAASLATTEIQTSPLSQAKFEIAIYEVGFDDTNANGQPDESELPLRDMITFPDDDSTAKPVDKPDTETLDPHRAKHGKVIEDTKDLKGVAAATTEQLDKWIDEYRKDPLQRSGAYAIISKDSITGVEVLKVFSIRDNDTDESSEAIDQNTGDFNESSNESEINKNLNSKDAPLPLVKPADRDDLSLALPKDYEGSIEWIACNWVYAGSGVAMVVASLHSQNGTSKPSFRRCARRMRNGDAT